jgi:hypothetical protein
VGDVLNRYTFISRISEDYIIPKFTDDVYFMEGRILTGEVLEDYIIELTLRREILGWFIDRDFIII